MLHRPDISPVSDSPEPTGLDHCGRSEYDQGIPFHHTSLLYKTSNKSGGCEFSDRHLIEIPV